MKHRKLRLTALALAMTTALTGCFFRGADQLYTVPQPPKDYEALRARLNEVVNAGGEYAAPLTGEFIQSVQLRDLDGDGEKEAIAFFRFNGEEKPLKIYIFRPVEDTYETVTVIEGAGTAINCVDYVQMDDSPFKEVVVSWQMSGQIHSLAAYAVGPDRAEELLRTDYDSYKLSDLDLDGQQELVVLRTSAEANGETAALAEFYDFREELGLVGVAPLSRGITGVAEGGMWAGTLSDGIPALFVVSACPEEAQVTDILALRDGTMTNITLDPETGESGGTLQFYNKVSCTDINKDGIMELPQSTPLPDYKVTSTTVNFWLTHWRQFDSNGTAKQVFSTYHNTRDGWYFILPEREGDAISITRSDQPGGGERAVTFSYWNGDEAVEPQPFLTIYKLTGSSRVRRAKSPGRFVLFPEEGLEGAADANTIYAAEFRDGWDCGLTEDEVRERFSLIRTDWLGGY